MSEKLFDAPGVIRDCFGKSHGPEDPLAPRASYAWAFAWASSSSVMVRSPLRKARGSRDCIFSDPQIRHVQ